MQECGVQMWGVRVELSSAVKGAICRLQPSKLGVEYGAAAVIVAVAVAVVQVCSHSGGLFVQLRDRCILGG